MPRLVGVSSVSKYCGEVERVTITTDPSQQGVEIKARTSNRTVIARVSPTRTDDQGAAEFEIICSNDSSCPGSATVTFTATGHAAHYLSVECKKEPKATARRRN